MVRLMELTGVAGLAMLLWKVFHSNMVMLWKIFLIIIAVEYLFVRFCSIWRWYDIKDRSFGIGLQFEKALVPTGYILTIASLWFLLKPSIIPLIIACALFVLIIHVNVILLSLHFKDDDKTPANFYTRIRLVDNQ